YDSDIGMCSSPIVLTATKGNEDEMMQAFSLGAEDYLLKENVSPAAVQIALNKARDLHDLRRSRHRAAAEMAHIRKMEAVGKLTAGVAHDFNNLLAVVMGNITQLRRKLDGAAFDSGDIAARIEAIENVSQRG